MTRDPSAEPEDAALEAPPLDDEPAPDWVERYPVEPNYDGWRLDQFLTHKLKRASRSKVVRIIEQGVRLAEGRRARPSLRVRTGDVVEIPRTERADPGTPPLDAIEVLHDRDGLLVLHKPAGMLVHRTAHEATRTVDAWLRATYPNERIEPGHRLDRDTAGCLVCARGDEGVRVLRGLFASEGVTKVYRARAADPEHRWSVGDMRVVRTALGFDATSEVGLRMGAGTLPCATWIEARARRGDDALLDVRIEGGRQHQIRVHLWMEGTPIVGDKLYEAGDAFFLAWRDRPGDPELAATLPRRWHALVARRVTLPWGGTTVEVEAPLPEDLRAPDETR